MDPKHTMRVGFAGESKQVEVDLPAGDLKPWDLDSKLRVVGTDVARVDGVAKVTGAAKYAFDMALPGMLHGAILRAKIPHGRVTSIDVAPARAMPGVRAAIALKGPDGQRSTVRFVGDAVAAVAADTLDQARDALAKIAVEYERREPVVELLKAKGAPKMENGEITEAWPEPGAPAPDEDEPHRKQRAQHEKLQAALAACQHVRTGTWFCEVQTHSALESHGNVCSWNDQAGTLDIWASTQATFGTAFGVAQALEIGADKVRVHAEFVGGGFGAKFSPGAEGVACAMLSREAKRPVKLMLDRFEEHTCAGNRPASLIQIRAGIDEKATIRAWDYRNYGGPGYTGSGGGTTFPRHYQSEAEIRETQLDLATNTDAGRPMRAPGRPQGYFAAEGMIDALAEAAGMDPLAFRVHNDKTALRHAEYELGAKEFGWKERWRPYGPRDKSAPLLRGAGMSSAFWGQMGNDGTDRGRGSPHAVTCRIHRDGAVESRNGAQDIGTGTKTVLATLTAEELQIEPKDVTVAMGCTDDPKGPMSGGSTMTPSIAPAARLAAGLAKQELQALVARHLGVEPAAVVVENGQWGVPGKSMLPFREACKLIGVEPITKTGQRFANYAGYLGNVCGCQFADVEVDTRTGIVRVVELLGIQDCGTLIAKKLAESQVLGAMIGGLSHALHEQRILDRRTGRMLNGDMIFYKIAGAADMPKLTAIMVDVRNGMNNVGAAGLGEAPSVATPAAIANAVANAIGAPMRSLPITPDRVLRALHGRAGGDQR